jgi:hypothetical protein
MDFGRAVSKVVSLVVLKVEKREYELVEMLAAKLEDTSVDSSVTHLVGVLGLK